MNQRNWKNTALITIIYLAFISLGLPDGVLGVAWPAIRADFGLPLESMGILTTLLLCLSAFSSIASGWLLRRWGTGGVTLASGLMTGTALLGYSIAPSFLWLVVCTVPLGLGQGAVDSGLNLYVAEHYSARHMNWLHCFWGMGASLGPVLMTQALMNANAWRSGYRTVSMIQLSLSVILLISLIGGLWARGHADTQQSGGENSGRDPEQGLSQKSAQAGAVLLFFLYSGIEFSVGLWLNSVLVESRHLPVALAGICATTFYASIMTGRFLSGAVVNRFGNMKMIRLGLTVAAAGGLCLFFSGHFAGMLAGTIMIGMGISPVYPCLMHETPHRFKKVVSDRLIGYQVGAACLGGSLIASGVGMLLSRVSLELLFPAVILQVLLSFAVNELLERAYQREIRK